MKQVKFMAAPKVLFWLHRQPQETARDVNPKTARRCSAGEFKAKSRSMSPVRDSKNQYALRAHTTPSGRREVGVVCADGRVA